MKASVPVIAIRNFHGCTTNHAVHVMREAHDLDMRQLDSPCYLLVMHETRSCELWLPTCRYQTSDGGPQFASLTSAEQIKYAQTTQTQQVAKLIKAGGVPPMFGEWAIAGAQCCHSL